MAGSFGKVLSKTHGSLLGPSKLGLMMMFEHVGVAALEVVAVAVVVGIFVDELAASEEVLAMDVNREDIFVADTGDALAVAATELFVVRQARSKQPCKSQNSIELLLSGQKSWSSILFVKSRHLLFLMLKPNETHWASFKQAA